jgi:hypothetical protein
MFMMKSTLIAILIVSYMLVVMGESGRCTFYYPNGEFGAFGTRIQNGDMVAALSLDKYNQYVNKCIQVNGPKGSVVVKVRSSSTSHVILHII